MTKSDYVSKTKNRTKKIIYAKNKRQINFNCEVLARQSCYGQFANVSPTQTPLRSRTVPRSIGYSEGSACSYVVAQTNASTNTRSSLNGHDTWVALQ